MDIPMDSENVAPRARFPVQVKNGQPSKGLGQRKPLCPVKPDNELLAKALSKTEAVPAKGEQEVTGKCHSNTLSSQVAGDSQAVKNPFSQSVPVLGEALGFSIFCDEDFDSPEAEELITDDDDESKANDTNDHYNVVTAQDRTVKDILDTSNLVLPNLDSPVMCADQPMVTSCQQSNTSPSASALSQCDSGDHHKLFSCVEYSDTVVSYLINLEKKCLPLCSYMTGQPEINDQMRTILIDWIVEVAEEYRLSDETVFLSVSYLDRYLSYNTIERSSFQLLGTSCLFIAAKYEEIYPPEVNEFVYVTDDSYTRRQVIEMEMQILKNLRMNVSGPTAYYFLQKYLDDLPVSSDVQNLAEFYCYLAILEGKQYLKFCPSELSLASVILAAHVFHEEDEILKSPIVSTIFTLQSSSLGISISAVKDRIRECMNYLTISHSSSASSTQATIHTRYSSSKHLSVAHKLPTSAPHI